MQRWQKLLIGTWEPWHTSRLNSSSRPHHPVTYKGVPPISKRLPARAGGLAVHGVDQGRKFSCHSSEFMCRQLAPQYRPLSGRARR